MGAFLQERNLGGEELEPRTEFKQGLLPLDPSARVIWVGKSLALACTSAFVHTLKMFQWKCVVGGGWGGPPPGCRLEPRNLGVASAVAGGRLERSGRWLQPGAAGGSDRPLTLGLGGAGPGRGGACGSQWAGSRAGRFRPGEWGVAPPVGMRREPLVDRLLARPPSYPTRLAKLWLACCRKILKDIHSAHTDPRCSGLTRVNRSLFSQT